MSALLLPVALLLAALAGAFVLAGFLWYGHAPALHAEARFPDDSVGAVLFRHGVAVGFGAFGGALLTFVLYLLAETAASPRGGPLAGLPFEVVAAGLFLLAAALFVGGAASYAVDAARIRFGVR